MNIKRLFDFHHPNYAHLFLNLPYKHGYHHLRLAFGVDKKILSASRTLSIDPPAPAKLQTLAQRVKHLILGLSECLPIIGIIVTFIAEYFLHKKPSHYHQFLDISNPPIFELGAWDLNLALLRDLYQRACGKQKDQLKFLATNFLAKITPKFLDQQYSQIKHLYPDYKSTQQTSPLEVYGYHREFLFNRVEFARPLNAKLAFGENSLFILTDTLEIDDILAVGYCLINTDCKKSYQEYIFDLLFDHWRRYGKQSCHQPLKRPLLVDTSLLIKTRIDCRKNPNEHAEFERELLGLELKVKETSDQAIKRLVSEISDMPFSTDDLKKLIESSVTYISKVELDGLCGIKILPAGSIPTKASQFSSHFCEFMIHTGLCIGAISLRRLVHDPFEQQSASLSSTQTTFKDLILYPAVDCFLKAPLFKRLQFVFSKISPQPAPHYGSNFSWLMTQASRMQSKPHLQILGKATMDLLEGVLKEAEKTSQWSALEKDSISWRVLQTTLHLIYLELDHLEQELPSDDFARFAQTIELIHSHLATLLELLAPFKEDDFEAIYQKELLGHSVPETLKTYLSAGLAKAAVNIFSGIIAAVRESKGYTQNVSQVSDIESVRGRSTYYEQATHLKYDFDELEKLPEGCFIDLYHGQFNTNVDVGSTLTEYRRVDISADINHLLEKGRAASHLTVAVDITIDEFYSSNVKELLMRFDSEIKSGRLNFVFFSSGQKFYTLGIDNYYGSTFYMVNNGASHWNSFKHLEKRPSLKIDSLSRQWFCLCTKYAADALEGYRRLIFQNTRYVLDRIPSTLAPGALQKQILRVNKVYQDMTPCFVDLKVLGNPQEQEKVSSELFLKFFEEMGKRKIMVYSRASFGFYHQNFAVFGPLDDKARTVRLNPGINPEENEALVGYFKSLAQTRSLVSPI